MTVHTTESACRKIDIAPYRKTVFLCYNWLVPFSVVSCRSPVGLAFNYNSSTRNAPRMG